LEHKQKIKSNPDESEPGNKNQANEYLKYTGLAFQMLAVIGVSVWAGLKLDEKFMGGKPVFLIILTFLGIFGSIYTLYRSLPKD
jgi:F0F1-type ATP synthase assembly protein I